MNADAAFTYIPGGIVIAGLAAGIDTFIYQVTDACGIFETSNEITIFDYSSCDSVLSAQNVLTGIQSLNIYPNPNTGTFTLELPTEGVATIAITDLLGKLVFGQTINYQNGQKVIFNLQNSSPGAYFVKIFSGEKVYREKIIVLR